MPYGEEEGCVSMPRTAAIPKDGGNMSGLPKNRRERPMTDTGHSERHRCVHHFLEESARQFPDKTALICEEGRFSYRQLNLLSDKLAACFISRGIRKGDRVVIILRNSPEYIVSYYGSLKAGAVAVPLSADIKPGSLRQLLVELEPTVLVTSHHHEKNVQEGCLENRSLKLLVLKNPRIPWDNSKYDVLEWGDMAGFDDIGLDDQSPGEDDLASIIYTSGSTGKPKGVMLTHANIVTNTNSICSYLRLTDQDIQMVVLPFHYVMGKSLLNTHFSVGGTVVLNNKFAYPASVIKQMIDERVTGFSGVPSTFAYLLHRSPLRNSRDKLEALRYCSQAGGHMSRQIVKDLRLALPEHTEIFVMYGATEASARLSYLDPSLLAGKVDSIGKEIPNVSMKVIDEEGKELSHGLTGEIVASGPNIMRGYWKDPDSTARVLDHNGYHTGDLGYRDDEGYLYLVGRKDNLLKVGGHRINPQEIEDTLEESGLLIEAVVLGVPDELLGHRLEAIAVPISDACSESALIQHCAGKLPRHKLPSSITLVKSLPKNANGKIDRVQCGNLLKS